MLYWEVGAHKGRILTGGRIWVWIYQQAKVFACFQRACMGVSSFLPQYEDMHWLG